MKWTNVKCSRCGKEKPTNPVAYEKRVAKFGSVENMLATWVCRDCVKAEKEARAIEESAEVMNEGEESPVVETDIEEAPTEPVPEPTVEPAEPSV